MQPDDSDEDAGVQRRRPNYANATSLRGRWIRVFYARAHRQRLAAIFAAKVTVSRGSADHRRALGLLGRYERGGDGSANTP